MHFLGNCTRFIALKVLCYLLPSNRQWSGVLHMHMSKMFSTVVSLILSQDNRQNIWLFIWQWISLINFLKEKKILLLQVSHPTSTFFFFGFYKSSQRIKVSEGLYLAYFSSFCLRFAIVKLVFEFRKKYHSQMKVIRMRLLESPQIFHDLNLNWHFYILEINAISDIRIQKSTYHV